MYSPRNRFKAPIATTSRQDDQEGRYIAVQWMVATPILHLIETIQGPPTIFGEGSPTKIDYRKRGTLILTSLLENLELFVGIYFGE